jgi:integrase
MSDTGAIIPTNKALAELEDLAVSATAYAVQSRADGTRRVYASHWADFTAWCPSMGLAALPAEPQTVALYLADRATTLTVSTLQGRISAISEAHEGAGHHLDTKHPAIKQTWSGIRRSLGTAQKGKKPTVIADIRDMVATLPDNLLGKRDRALLLIGFAGALRRSELVGLDIGASTENGTGYVEFADDGLIVTLSRSKSDQEGEGQTVGIPHGEVASTCPVKALQAWLDAAGIEDGPIFRPINRHGHVGERRLSDKAVALVVKRTVKAAMLARGLSEADADAAAKNVAGHSLRAGLVTSAAAAGVEERVIMDQTRHKHASTLRKYVRLGSLFQQNAAGRVGL